MTSGPILTASACALTAATVLGPRHPRIWLTLTGMAVAAGLSAAVWAFCSAADWLWVSAWALGGEPIRLRLDGLSALFLALLSVVGGAGAVYGRAYWSDAHHPASAPRGRACWSASLLSMGLVLLANDGLHFLLAWELFSVCSFLLITLDQRKRETRAAGWLFLASSHAGTVCLFGFFSALAAKTGGWALGPMQDRPELAPLFWLALAGFGLKAGVFPLHVWLPSAHANAPSHVSAMLSGVGIKMGVYGLVRFSGWLPTPHLAGGVVLGLGASGALFGIAFALAQNDLKRLLAYCSVENVGVILIGLGAGLLGVSRGDSRWGRLALAGALFHVWTHGAFKSLLFLGAGSVVHAAGTREMSRLGGLWRAMPWTAALFALGAAAAAGLPPLGGFVSEWILGLGLFDAAVSHSPAAVLAAAAAIVLATSGAAALAALLKAASITFLGAPRTLRAPTAHESGPLMIGPMLAMAGLCVLTGLAPAFLWPAIHRSVSAWRPAVDEPPAVQTAPLGALGCAQSAVAVVGIATAVALQRKTRTNGMRRTNTWDCGFAAPTARMQYTSGSFSDLAADWFAWLLRPDRVLRRPEGPFPTQASCVEQTPDTVLSTIVTPAAGKVLWMATAARRLQHGRLQFYILYLVFGLVGLGVLVGLESAP